jgi:DNA (cytosine-5)-methyltransferase 1
LSGFCNEYLITCKKLNAINFGVPQNRERLFVFGIRKKMVKEIALNNRSIYDDSWFPWPKPIFPDALQKYDWGEPYYRQTAYSLKLLPSPPPELCVGNIIIDDAEIGYIPNSNEYFKLMDLSKVEKIEEGDTYRPSFKRLHRLKYSPAACYGNNEVHLHPTSTRRISVREALRIQGVPDTYILSTPDKLSKKFKMIGNGVPVPLATQIAKSIKKFLKQIGSETI